MLSATKPTSVRVSLTAMRLRTNASGPVIGGIIAPRGPPRVRQLVRLPIFSWLGIPNPASPFRTPGGRDEAARDDVPAAGRVLDARPRSHGRRAEQTGRDSDHRREPEVHPRGSEGQGGPAVRARRDEQGRDGRGGPEQGAPV